MMEVRTTKVYREISRAVDSGYTTISEQGSSRSGKTYNTLIWLIFYCMQNPCTRLSVVRATLPALKGSSFIDFKEILFSIDLYDERCMNRSELIYTFPNGSLVEFFSCDSEQKLRGRKRDVLFINEANELDYYKFQQLQMRTTRLTIIDYNPSFSDEHWICRLNKEQSTYHFITTYKDNKFLERKIVKELESLKWKNATLWQVYGLGQQAMIEGLVFRNVDMVDEIPATARHRWIGMDFGFTNDPTAIVEVAIDGDTLYINEICYQTEMLSADIIRILKNECSGMEIISESADPRMVQEIYRAGVNIHPVVKYKGSIEAGIAKMLEYKIRITRRSANVQREFKNYVYAQDKEGKYLNSPIDYFNHAIDAVRYVVMMRVMSGHNNGIRRISF